MQHFQPLPPDIFQLIIRQVEKKDKKIVSLANLHTAILGFSLNTKTLNRPKQTKRLWGTSITNGLGKVLSFKEERYLK